MWEEYRQYEHRKIQDFIKRMVLSKVIPDIKLGSLENVFQRRIRLADSAGLWQGPIYEVCLDGLLLTT